jgi:hypothetical protein
VGGFWVYASERDGREVGQEAHDGKSSGKPQTPPGSTRTGHIRSAWDTANGA